MSSRQLSLERVEGRAFGQLVLCPKETMSCLKPSVNINPGQEVSLARTQKQAAPYIVLFVSSETTTSAKMPSALVFPVPSVGSRGHRLGSSDRSGDWRNCQGSVKCLETESRVCRSPPRCSSPLRFSLSLGKASAPPHLPKSSPGLAPRVDPERAPLGPR